MRGKQEKNPQNYRCSTFRPRCLLENEALFCQLNWRRNSSHFYVDFLISLSLFSQLSLSPLLYISLHTLHLPPHPHLHLNLPPHLYLPPLHRKQSQSGGNSSLRFAYSWENCLKIVLYSAEMERH
jgi:hypothetical protein